MKTHDLKCWPVFFEALVKGTKTFELRKDDRGFQAGDHLLLREWSPSSETYSGRELTFRVGFVLHGAPKWGLSGDVAVMSLLPVKEMPWGS